MKNAFTTFAFVLALAIGPVATGQTDSFYVLGIGDAGQDGTVYDIGVKTTDETGKVESVKAPEGKADRIVVLTATWCGPCQLMKPAILALKAQGYKVEYYDVDRDLEKLANKYSNIKRVSGSEELNHWSVVPTIFFVREDMIIKKIEGFTTAVKIRETLWKPSDKESRPVENVRRRLPWNK